jgi:Protein of unknown function (DUF3592)
VQKPKAASALVLLAVGATLVLAAVLAKQGARASAVAAALNHRGVAAEATVTAVDHEIEDVEPFGGTRQWTQVTVSFADARGTRIRATQEGRDSTRVGQRMRIAYDPVHPEYVRLNLPVDDGLVDYISAGALAAAAGLLPLARRGGVRRRRPGIGGTAPAGGRADHMRST